MRACSFEHFRAIFKCAEGSSRASIAEFDFRIEEGRASGETPNLLNTIKSHLTEEQRRNLDRPISAKEIKEAWFCCGVLSR